MTWNPGYSVPTPNPDGDEVGTGLSDAEVAETLGELEASLGELSDERATKSNVGGVQAHLSSTVSAITTGAVALPLSEDNDPLGIVSANIMSPEPGLYDFHCRTTWGSATNNKLIWLNKNGGIFLVDQSIGSIASATFLDVAVQEGDTFQWFVSMAAGTGGSVTAANVTVRRSGDPFG